MATYCDTPIPACEPPAIGVRFDLRVMSHYANGSREATVRAEVSRSGDIMLPDGYRSYHRGTTRYLTAPERAAVESALEGRTVREGTSTL